MKTKFVVRKDYTESLWDDGAKPILDKIGGEVEITRASHVDPVKPPSVLSWLNPGNWVKNWEITNFIKVHGNECFGIFWKGDVKQWGMALLGDNNQPFHTKKAAVAFEVEYLKTHHLGL